MCVLKLEQLLHILHKSSKRSESKTKINALTHFAYLNTHYKFCVKHYSQCTILGVEIIKHFALFFQENYAGDNKNYATAGPTGRAKYQLWVTSFKSQQNSSGSDRNIWEQFSVEPKPLSFKACHLSLIFWHLWSMPMKFFWSIKISMPFFIDFGPK